MRKTKEIRRLLMGRFTVRNGRVQLCKMGEIRVYAGGSGAINATFLGVMQRKQFCRIPEDADWKQDAMNVLQQMGNIADLQETPEIPACLCRSTIMDQHVLTADKTDDGLLELSIFQGRSLLGLLSSAFALRRFASLFPESYAKVAVPKKTRGERRLERLENRQKRKQQKRKGSFKRRKRSNPGLLRTLIQLRQSGVPEVPQNRQEDGQTEPKEP